MSSKKNNDRLLNKRRRFLKDVLRTGAFSCFAFVNLPALRVGNRPQQGICYVPVCNPCAPDENCGRYYSHGMYREDYNCGNTPELTNWNDRDCGLPSRHSGPGVWSDGSCFQNSGVGVIYDDGDCGKSNEFGFAYQDAACGQVLIQGGNPVGDQDCGKKTGIGTADHNDDDCGIKVGGAEYADESCGQVGPDSDSKPGDDHCGLMGPDYQTYVDV